MGESKKVKSTVSMRDSNVMLCLLFIVLGVLFVWLESAVSEIAMMTIGVIATVLGLFELFHKNWIMGVVEVLIGVALIVIAAVKPDIAILILGIAILLFAIILGVVTIKHFKGMAALSKVLFILTIVLALVVGILFIVAYAVSGVDGIFIAIGALSLAAGVVMLVKAAITGGKAV
ncbi:MAG: hypothetical protein U0M04_01595 [Christensenellales bacterium]|nr:hypothetical protein [Christensenellales bacterium]